MSSGARMRLPALSKRVLRTCLGLVGAAIIFLVTLELLLAIWPGLLTRRLGNHAFGRYDSNPGGIYFLDPETGLRFMRPGFETRMYFNGYSWSHATDAFGFRTPTELQERSALLLGDSMIYGHGVEAEETVAGFLQSTHRRGAYNMARQGDCLYQNYVLLRLNLDRLRPETVVLFVFVNDFDDLLFYRTPDSLRLPPELQWDYRAMLLRVEELRYMGPRDPIALLGGLSGVRLIRGSFGELVSRWNSPPGYRPQVRFIDTLVDDEAFDTAATYYRTILGDLSALLAREGVQLQLVLLDVEPSWVRWESDLGGRAPRARIRLAQFFDRMCHQLDLRCDSTTQLFSGCTDCLLPHDGHLSAVGHRRLATFIDERLDRLPGEQ